MGVQVSTETLLADLVGQELAARKKEGKYKGTFQPLGFSLGYQARCSLPRQAVGGTAPDLTIPPVPHPRLPCPALVLPPRPPLSLTLPSRVPCLLFLAPCSNFDCSYAYTLGMVAASLVAGGFTGYAAAVSGLQEPVEKWHPYVS